MMKTANRSEVLCQLKRLIGQTFQISPDTIEAATVATDITGWDSLSHTVLMFTIEDQFGVELDPEVELTDVGHLAVLIETALVKQ